MRNPTAYLKMRVLGAVDRAPGHSIAARIKALSHMTFTDEEGNPRRFTWRTIQTWYSRFQKHGLTVMENKARSAKGKIERFFRTVRDQFLSRSLDTSSLEALNRQFTLWVEEDSNSSKRRREISNCPSCPVLSSKKAIGAGPGATWPATPSTSLFKSWA